MTRAYPLQWPDGWPRTRDSERKGWSSFRVTGDKALKELRHELRLLGAQDVVISTNAAVRQDGLPYADAARRKISDPGVAVYFTLKKRQMVMARDAFAKIEDNVRSITLAIEAIRAIERHGGSAMMERAFSGFSALPPPRDHWAILGIPPTSTIDEIEETYRRLARKAHPDAGGSTAGMAELNAARDAAVTERTGA